MNSFIKSVKAAAGSKETLIKNSIMTHLSESVKEIQLCGMEENISGDSMEIGEAANSLCTVLEAMFLHGLKDSLVHRAKRAVADIDQSPEPSFWAPLLVISHRQIIDQINNFSQITTEIGQCRAWIRVALNDCLLSSYFSAIRNDSAALKPYYNTSAYVRDSELLDVAQRLIEGVETFSDFTLPCNCSLLNKWSLPALLLAGVWSPTLRSCPIQSGVDVAQSLNATPSINSETTSLASAVSLNSHSSGLWQMALDEDAALKIILGKTTKDIPEQIFARSDSPQLSVAEVITSSESSSSIERSEGINVQEIATTNIGNSLNRKSGWSFDEGQAGVAASAKDTETNTEPSTPLLNNEGSKSMEHSYNALIESYNLLGGSYTKTPDLRSVWERFETGRKESESNDEDNQALVNMGYEVLSSKSLHFSNSELSSIGRISKERGLDAQNYECRGCKKPLGINSSKPKVCAFTGNYYCDNCMSKDEISIPARIIHNWDFKSYPVSRYAIDYIDDVRDQPTIDFKILNPCIYGAAKDMAILRTLRIQLNFLRAYLYTCREPVIEQLQQQLWPREYMYEHIHQYSISDLLQIPSGNLSQHLQKVVNFCKEHVMGCWLCCQKGFVCEVCNNSKVLYPFDIDTTYRCENCNAVYHTLCLNTSMPCPKCERRKKREDEPPLPITKVNNE